MVIVYVLIALVIGFALGMFTMSMFVANVVRQNGGRYTYVLPEYDEAQPNTAGMPQARPHFQSK